MYSVNARKQLIHVVDLDPYGTAAPFIDAAVQAVTDDGTRYVSSACNCGHSRELDRPIVRDMHRSRSSGWYELS